MDILKVLSINVRYYRKQAGYSQEVLANKTGLHRTYIGGIEQRRVNVSTQNLQKIALALNVEAYQLLKPMDC
ncbi:MAG: helix-turn-helix transcriptional regulator [Coriobacteriales bacterium]|jgi:transcriptional regulator with XRE-family HTH domain|nr:helix-turn-helix transcriptional regulator [Coriobacteriales bacterium]